MSLTHPVLGPPVRAAHFLACRARILLASTSRASATTCHGDHCSDKDLLATGCAREPRTVTSNHLPGVERMLELRWFLTRQTSWARILYGTNPVWVKAIRKPGGYTQRVSDRMSTSAWSRRVYSSKKCVYAVVHTRAWDQFATSCI